MSLLSLDDLTIIAPLTNTSHFPSVSSISSDGFPARTEFSKGDGFSVSKTDFARAGRPVETSTSIGLFIGIACALLLLILVGILVFVLLYRRRKKSGADGMEYETETSYMNGGNELGEEGTMSFLSGHQESEMDNPGSGLFEFSVEEAALNLFQS
jgi:hypothetical protein